MVKAVIFDAFGTLVRPVGARGPYAKLSKLLPSNNYLIKRHELMTTNRSFDDFVREAGSSDEMNALKKELDAEVNSITLYDDVLSYIDVLKWKGYKVGVCSNLAHAYGASVKRLLSDADGIFLSYEIGLIKPDPKIYLHVAESLGFAPDDCLFVGDSIGSDLKGPAKVGMHSHLLSRWHNSPAIGQQIDPVLETFWK